MDIKRTNNLNFGSATIIKTKKPKLLNILNDLDFQYWKHDTPLKHKYEPITWGSMTDKDGFWKGLYMDGEDIKRPYIAQENADTVEISTEDDLLALPFLSEAKSFLIELLKR